MAVDQSGVVVRAAAARDVTAVRSLLRDAGLPVDGLEDQFGEGYAIAELDGWVIGVEGIEVYGRFGLLRSAAVAARHRGTGLGVRLTEDRIAWARHRKLESIYLLTTTAAPFFARCGFAPVPKTSAPPEVQASREFTAICPSTATCMQLALGG